ncbi:glycoside hydrolase family 16 protein [Paxillus rubicundulus Ve08.2h10]|uniref:Glycoside hydrolase family 16 protein n=1 Tax=Paxillus rubicundulus Ve08.2h10 TaxID=930991 RepID=A0A0D0DQ54_9AGAM|nr:glycoside hydrolase family 16 protein [Paxillus rubicundulus Ve08.2h10]
MDPNDELRFPLQTPFFIGDDGRAERSSHHPQLSLSSSSVLSRPSTPGTPNPFSPPASVRNFDVSSQESPPPIPPIPGDEPTLRHGVHIAPRTEFPRTSSYYGVGRPANLPSRNSSRIRLRETFAAPPPRSLIAHSAAPSLVPKKAKRMRSTLLEDPSTLEKPWVTHKDPFARVAYFLTYGVAFLGIVASAVRCYFGYKSVPMIHGNLCMVLDEEFDTDTNTVFGSGGKWFREVELGGFGNGEFEMTTSSTNNSYVQNGYLYLTPTLTSDAIGTDNLFNGYTYNLTDCTYNLTNPESLPGSTNSSSFDPTAYYQACGAVSNTTTGTIINPVQSARVSTMQSASIKYGRVELWPAIWMLPVNNTYGAWPLSGEIDIMESRGNSRSYPDQGIDYVRGSLNWGPLSFLNAVSKTYGWWTQRRTDYGESFHTYALEWTSDFLRIYVDTRLHFMLELSFNEPFFTRGNFPSVVQNGSTPIVLENPWVNGTNATPFDQPFYLILDLAVGGTNGWFPDNAGSKPWLDGSNIAMREFALAQDTWYPTWGSDNEDRSFIIDYVKMWQLC